MTAELVIRQARATLVHAIRNGVSSTTNYDCGVEKFRQLLSIDQIRRQSTASTWSRWLTPSIRQQQQVGVEWDVKAGDLCVVCLSVCVVFVYAEFRVDRGWPERWQQPVSAVCRWHLSSDIWAAWAAVDWAVWHCGWTRRPAAALSVQWMPRVISS